MFSSKAKRSPLQRPERPDGILSHLVLRWSTSALASYVGLSTSTEDLGARDDMVAFTADIEAFDLALLFGLGAIDGEMGVGSLVTSFCHFQHARRWSVYDKP